MRILFNDFVITDSLGINKFDVSRIATIQKGKTKGQKIERNLAYGITLERVFRIILDETVEDKVKDLEITFEKYFKIYQESNEEIKIEAQRIEATLLK
jgi:hypothetical protein